LKASEKKSHGKKKRNTAMRALREAGCNLPVGRRLSPTTKRRGKEGINVGLKTGSRA